MEDREVYNVLMAHRRVICQPQSHTRKRDINLTKQFPIFKELVSFLPKDRIQTSYQEMVSVSGSESESDGAKQFLVSKLSTKDGEDTADTADNVNQQERLDILSSSSSRSVAVQFDVG